MESMQRLVPRRSKRRRLLVWPIVLGWRLATWTVDLTGILLGLILGLVFMMLGMLLCSTLVGILIGFPLAAFGLLLLLRALY